MLKIPKLDKKPQMPPITFINIPQKTIIKTIAENDPELFDCKVNELLEDGWKLVGRQVIASNESKLIVFYAALEKLCIEKVGEI